MRIGVDLGGSKIEAVALDGAGVVRARRRIATPRGDSSGVRGAARLWPEEPTPEGLTPEELTQVGPGPGGGPR